MRAKVRCAGHVIGQDCWEMVAPGDFFCGWPNSGCWAVWDARHRHWTQPKLPLDGQQEGLWPAPFDAPEAEQAEMEAGRA